MTKFLSISILLAAGILILAGISAVHPPAPPTFDTLLKQIDQRDAAIGQSIEKNAAKNAKLRVSLDDLERSIRELDAHTARIKTNRERLEWVERHVP